MSTDAIVLLTNDHQETLEPLLQMIGAVVT